jgi:hypothetical protein
MSVEVGEKFGYVGIICYRDNVYFPMYVVTDQFCHDCL